MIAFGFSAGGWLAAAACAPWWWLRLACLALATVAGLLLVVVWLYERDLERSERLARREVERDERIAAEWLNHTFSAN